MLNLKKNKIMKIVIKRNENHPKVTIELNDFHYAYQIRNAIELALKIEGIEERTILEVFNHYEDVKQEPNK